MSAVRGRFAAAMAICSGLSTALVHLFTQARMVTVFIRTCIAAGGALVIGLLLEYYFRKSLDPAEPADGQQTGRYLNVSIGSHEAEEDMLQMSTDGRVDDGAS